MTREQIKTRIAEIQNEISNLQMEEKALNIEYIQLIAQENTNELLEDIYTVNGGNSQFTRLFRDTKTTPLMDEFYNSDKKFLLFTNDIFTDNSCPKAFLVVAKCRSNINAIDSGLTITDLKKTTSYWPWSNFAWQHCPESSRLFALVQEIDFASPKITKKRSAVPFRNPVRLGAQTFDNQTGYGSSYEGEFQVIQGTLYGETTSFYIIGLVNLDDE